MFEDFSDVFASKIRLMVITALYSGKKDFTTLKKLTNASDGNLGKQLEIIVASGYISTEKESRGKRSRTVYSLTMEGRDAFRRYVQTLAEIIESE